MQAVRHMIGSISSSFRYFFATIKARSSKIRCNYIPPRQKSQKLAEIKYDVIYFWYDCNSLLTQPAASRSKRFRLAAEFQPAAS
jgi:hypothetical protein